VNGLRPRRHAPRTGYALHFPWLLAALLLLDVRGGANEHIRVAATHPLIGDLARQVGGERVMVIDMIPAGQNVHGFQPTPSLLREVSKAHVVLASGKHLEDGWIGKVRDNLPENVQVHEVGRRIPSLTVDPKNELFVCCPNHSHGALDPHWWHSIDHMIRATKFVAGYLSDVDPAGKAVYQQNARAYSEKLRSLHQWAKSEIARVEKSKRVLCTAHLAFAYFCDDFGFKMVPVLGLNAEHDPAPGQLAETIGHIKANRVTTIFPESGANPKSLDIIRKETGATLGGTLLADSPTADAPSYIDMMKYNIKTIVDSLTQAR